MSLRKTTLQRKRLRLKRGYTIDHSYISAHGYQRENGVSVFSNYYKLYPKTHDIETKSYQRLCDNTVDDRTLFFSFLYTVYKLWDVNNQIKQNEQ